MTRPTISNAVLDRLRQYDTPTICNVIELFDVRPRNEGYLDQHIRAVYPKLPPMVGFASTATFRSAAPPTDAKGYGGLNEQVEAFAQKGGPIVVVIQDLDEPIAAACFGEIMCTTYKSYGAVGLVTNGTGRDIDQVAALQFPCFTSGTMCAHGYCHLPQLDVPVRIGGVRILPGDLLHGDCNGVTTIPLAIAAAVADACAEYMAAEGVVLDYLKSGKLDARGYAAARRECQARLDALAQKVKA
jgi:regulator of RNase E activity RraA